MSRDKNLLQNLETLLSKDGRLVSEVEILKNKVIELALKLDKDLLLAKEPCWCFFNIHFLFLGFM